MKKQAKTLQPPFHPPERAHGAQTKTAAKRISLAAVFSPSTSYFKSNAKCCIKRHRLFSILKAKILRRKLDCISRLISLHVDL